MAGGAWLRAESMLSACEVLVLPKINRQIRQALQQPEDRGQAGLNQEQYAKCDSVFLDILGTVVAWTMIDTCTDICTSGSWPSISHLWLDLSHTPQTPSSPC